MSGVAVQHCQVLVHFAASLKDSASLVHLCGGRTAVRNALVQRTPVDGGQTSADHDALAGGQVALLEHAVLKDLIALGQQFRDDRNAALGIGALGPIGQREVVGSKHCHWKFPFVELGVGWIQSIG